MWFPKIVHVLLQLARLEPKSPKGERNVLTIKPRGPTIILIHFEVAFFTKSLIKLTD
jgi:hypothetical protein